MIEVHPDGTIAQPCTRCGELTLSILETVIADAEQAARLEVEVGAVVDERFVCRACQPAHFAEADALREKFDALIAGGMSREMANRVMIRWHISEAPGAVVARRPS